MDIKQIEELAAKNKPLPEGMKMGEVYFYKIMQMLYHQLRNGDIDKDTAAREKREAVHALNDMAVYEQAAGNVEQWKAVARAMSEYDSNRTIENADVLWTAIFGFGFVRYEAGGT